jgi:hypothetical protein
VVNYVRLVAVTEVGTPNIQGWVSKTVIYHFISGPSFGIGHLLKAVRLREVLREVLWEVLWEVQPMMFMFLQLRQVIRNSLQWNAGLYEVKFSITSSTALRITQLDQVDHNL